MPRKGHHSDNSLVSHSLAVRRELPALLHRPVIETVPNGKKGVFRAVIAIEG